MGFMIGTRGGLNFISRKKKKKKLKQTSKNVLLFFKSSYVCVCFFNLHTFLWFKTYLQIKL